jgi:hypothetical protein
LEFAPMLQNPATIIAMKAISWGDFETKSAAPASSSSLPGLARRTAQSFSALYF